MKFITVNDNHKVSISSFDDLFMGFSIDSDLGFLFLKNRVDSDYIELEMYNEQTKKDSICQQISPLLIISEIKQRKMLLN